METQPHCAQRAKYAQFIAAFKGRMNIRDLNAIAWNQAVDDANNPYTTVVSPEQVAAARAGQWDLYLSDSRPVPRDWFPAFEEAKVLCLASGGGQQAPVFAALGAEVTLLDASIKQLAQDRFVAERDGLRIETIEGDMADLSMLEAGRFDLIFNPVSTIFVPDLRPIWPACHRVLRTGGALMTGFMNPDEFVFDANALDNEGAFVVKHPLPFIEHETLSAQELEDYKRDKRMLHFSHTMEAQIGGLIEAGFVITGFYEDRRLESDGNPIRNFMPSFFVVKAQKIEPR
jgi:SAM-dependent methyltransferase